MKVEKDKNAKGAAPIKQAAAKTQSAKQKSAAETKSSAKPVKKETKAAEKKDTAKTKASAAAKAKTESPVAKKARAAKVPKEPPARKAAKTSAKQDAKPPSRAKASGKAETPKSKTRAASSKPAEKTAAKKKTPVAVAKAPKSPTKEKPQKQEPAPKPKRKVVFKLNQKVVYPSQGVGKIIEILEKKFNSKPLSYYKIYLEVSDMIIMVPVNRVEELGIRAIVKPAEAQSALEMIGQDVEPITSDWKLRYQMNLDLLKKGTVADIATIVRSLYHRSKVKELPVLERKLYDSAKKLLEDEVSYSLNIPVKEVEAMIHARLEPAGIVRTAKQHTADDDFLDDDFPEENESEKDDGLPFEEDDDIGSDSDEE
jgi:CarD family transcriptional regulator